MTNNEFFVGYLPAPKGLARFMRLSAGFWIVGAIVFSLVLAFQQADPGPGVWDLDNIVEIEGELEVDPYAILYVSPEDGKGPLRAVLLVSQLKFGPGERAERLNGKRVKVRGNFISYDNRSMFELVDGEEAFSVVETAATKPKKTSLGEHTLVGEIVDSKCFLGVMKPGYGKTHRACAVRCISGGITPLFVTRESDGEPTFYVLSDDQGQALNQWSLPYVAEAIELKGSLERRGDLLHFSVATESVSRK